jgi:hypothetical protein
MSAPSLAAWREPERLALQGLGPPTFERRMLCGELGGRSGRLGQQGSLMLRLNEVVGRVRRDISSTGECEGFLCGWSLSPTGESDARQGFEWLLGSMRAREAGVWASPRPHAVRQLSSSRTANPHQRPDPTRWKAVRHPRTGRARTTIIVRTRFPADQEVSRLRQRIRSVSRPGRSPRALLRLGR